jgi:nucleoside 2-deoxyribosyltransferase
MRAMDMKKIIYIAGPLFSEAERIFNVGLAGMLKTAGYAVFLPQENSADTARGREILDNKELFKKDVEELEQSDLVVAILDGSDVDSGTAWEIGYARARNIPVVGLRTDFRTLGIEGRVNLMIEESIDGIYTTSEELINSLDNKK